MSQSFYEGKFNSLWLCCESFSLLLPVMGSMVLFRLGKVRVKASSRGKRAARVCANFVLLP